MYIPTMTFITYILRPKVNFIIDQVSLIENYSPVQVIFRVKNEKIALMIEYQSADKNTKDPSTSFSVFLSI